MNDHSQLGKAIEKLHGCGSQHTESVPVKETFRGQTVWEGTVEVFDLTDHPKAKRCYAWSFTEDDGSERHVAVLELSPVCSAETAVRAAIVAESKGR